MQFVVWVMGAVAAYNLWEEVTWLSIVIALTAFSYGAHGDERAYYQAHGEFPTSTATRFFLTFTAVLGVLIYSFTI